jgi:curli biogenesis system outer membrane secretion channel CsgG
MNGTERVSTERRIEKTREVLGINHRSGSGSESSELDGNPVDRENRGEEVRGSSVAGAVLCLLLAATTAVAQSAPTQKLRVAVMDMGGAALKMQTTTMGIPGQPMPVQQPYQQPYGQPQPGTQTTVSVAIPPPSEFARGLTEMLTSVLVRTNRFVVLERAAMQQIEQEQTIGQTKTTKETGAQQGGMLGAQALIIGDITGFTFNKSSIGGSATNLIPGLGVAAERVSAEVIIDLRLIDATSGQILFSTKGKGKASQTGLAADLVKGEKSYSADATMTTPLGQASRQALQEAVVGLLVGMPKMRWSARVVDVRDEVIYLGAAASDGMQPGLELEVYEMGEALIDPATGQSLGAPERFVGLVKVETVLERFSTAKVVNGAGLARGQVVRLKGQTPR